MVFFHGGGWVAGDLDTHDRQARWLAIETGAVVVSVDYRRPPEVRFPGAFEDAFAATKDVIARIAEFGGDERASAWPVTAPAAIWRPPPRSPAATPASNWRRNCWSIPSPTSPEISRIQKRTRAFPRAARTRKAISSPAPPWNGFAAITSPTRPHGTDWRVSPLRAKNLAGLAPAIVATAWFDPLRDEGKAYADALAAAGVPTSYYDGLGLIHGYFGLGEASETARREAQRARADFKALLDKGA